MGLPDDKVLIDRGAATVVGDVPQPGMLGCADTMMAAGEAVPEPSPPGSAPDRVGRFKIIDRLGIGGMGVVYSAYDSQLDRRIAIKLVRAGAGDGFDSRQQQLQREAQAMARLAHPNVVAVYEVGLHRGQIYVAMEFVSGSTLRGWLESTPRSWAEIRRAFTQAGRGLAAAHRAGMVHRDFKPENVLIGADRRARVADFGLVYPLDDGVPEVSEEDDTGRQAAAAALRAERLSKEGRIAGTPAYMSPEQWRGGEITASSDQFSFCVALFEACYGELPFAGTNAIEISTNVLNGELRVPMRTSRIPNRVYAVLARGLERDPEERWPSMEALLGALSASPGRWGLRIGAGAVAVLGVAGITTMMLSAVEREARACAGDALYEAAWGDAQRDALRSAFADSGAPNPGELWLQVDARLGAYAEEWRTIRSATCEAHRQGVESDSLFDRRIQCLDERYAEFDAAVDLLVGGQVEAGAINLVTSLAPLSVCANDEVLEAVIPPPEDPASARRVKILRDLLVEVQAYENAGEYAEANAIAAPIEGLLQEIDFPPARAQALLRRGSLEMELGGIEEAEQDLYESLWGALDVGDVATACEALGKWIFVVGAVDGRTEEALALERLALVVAEKPVSAESCSHTIYNNLGSVIHRSGDATRARTFYERALSVAEPFKESVPLDYAATLSNLGLVEIGEERYAEAIPFFREAINVYTVTIGERHPYLAATLTNSGEAKAGVGDRGGARADYLQALEIFREALGPTHPRLGYPHLGLAKVALAGDERDLARRHSRLAVELWLQSEEPPRELAEALDFRASMHISDGELDSARVALRKSIRLRLEENDDSAELHWAIDALLAVAERAGIERADEPVLNDFIEHQRKDLCGDSASDSDTERRDSLQRVNRAQGVLKAAARR